MSAAEITAYNVNVFTLFVYCGTQSTRQLPPNLHKLLQRRKKRVGVPDALGVGAVVVSADIYIRREYGNACIRFILIASLITVEAPVAPTPPTTVPPATSRLPYGSGRRNRSKFQRLRSTGLTQA